MDYTVRTWIITGDWNEVTVCFLLTQLFILKSFVLQVSPSSTSGNHHSSALEWESKWGQKVCPRLQPELLPQELLMLCAVLRRKLIRVSKYSHKHIRHVPLPNTLHILRHSLGYSYINILYITGITKKTLLYSFETGFVTYRDISKLLKCSSTWTLSGMNIFMLTRNWDCAFLCSSDYLGKGTWNIWNNAWNKKGGQKMITIQVPDTSQRLVLYRDYVDASVTTW